MKSPYDKVQGLPEMTRLATYPMGIGSGRKLVESIEECAKTRYEGIVLSSNPNAENFYEKMGYEVIDRVIEPFVPSGDYVSAIMMKRF